VLLLFISGCNRGAASASTTTAAAGNGAAANGAAGENGIPEEIIAVEAELVTSGDFFSAIESSGVVRGAQEVTVVSETSGIIESMSVRLGERIERNQILVTLDSVLERSSVDQMADQLAVAEIEFAAITQLYENGNSSPAELASAKAAVSGNRSALAQAQRQLDNRIIRSPISGRIAVIPSTISVGNYIQPGATIVRIVNMNRARIDLGVGEREIQMINVGDEVRVYVDACGIEPQRATVRAIAAGSGDQNGSFTVQIEFQNTCGASLKSGMSARVEIFQAQEGDDTIIIPSRALLREAEDYFVFVARQDGAGYYAERRPVDISRLLGDRAEIGDGLIEQEILVIAPIQMLEDGAEINPITIRG